MARRSSIRNVVIAAWLPAFLIAAVAVYAGASQVRALARESRRLLAGATSLATILDDARADALRFSMLAVRLPDDETAARRLRDRRALATETSDFDTVIERAVTLHPRHARTLEGFARRFAVAAARADAIVSALDRGDRAIASERARRTSRDARVIADEIDASIHAEQDVAMAQAAMLGVANDRALLTTGVLLLLGIVAAFALGMLLVRLHIVQTTLALTAAIRDLAAGQLDVTLPFTDLHNELGDSARALVALRDSFRMHARERRAHDLLRDITERVQKTESLETLGWTLLDGLGAAVPLRAGRLLVASEGASEMSCAARIGDVADAEFEERALRLPIVRGRVLGLLLLVPVSPLTDEQRALAEATAAASAIHVRLLQSASATAELLAHTQAQAEELASAQARQRQLLDSVASGIVGIDAHGLSTFVNPSACTLLGYPPDELLGVDLHHLTHHSHPDGTPYEHDACPIAWSLRNGARRTVPLEHFVRKDGRLLPVEVQVSPIIVAGVTQGVVVSFSDISDRLRLARERDFTQYVTDHGADAKIWSDPSDGRIVYANVAACRLIGRVREELVGSRYADLPFANERALDLHDGKMRPGDPPVHIESVIDEDGGRAIDVEIVSFVASDGTRTLRIDTIRDISDRRALRELRALQGELQLTNRALRTLGAANAAIVRSADEATLAQRSCEVIVDVGGYDTAWIGVLDSDDERAFRVVGLAGTNTEWIGAHASFADDESAGAGIVVDAYRTGEARFFEGTMIDPRLQPWGARLHEVGLHSAIAIPLLSPSGIVGVLGVYAREPGLHSPELMPLWKQLGEDIGFGVTALRLREARDELRVGKEAAEAAVRIKSEFLANMSHELRTPMNAIVGLTYLLQKTELDARQTEYLDSVVRSSELLLSIINDILDYSKIEAGMLAIEAVDCALDDVVTNVHLLVAERAREKGVAFSFELDPNMPQHVRGDPLRLGQVLVNLCNNAVKFTEHGGIVVRGSVGRREDEPLLLRFSVSDTGIGIPPDYLPSLFEMFTQADASTTRRYGGSGLGLAISKRLVEAMGGEIGVESELGVGSTFWFTVRVGAVREAPAERPAAEAIRGRRALVVSSDRIAREAAAAALGSIGIEVTGCATAGEALTAFQRALEGGAPYGLAIVDRTRIGMEAAAFARRVRAAAPRAQQLTLIMLSSEYREEILRRARAVGFAAVIPKPIDPSAIETVVGDVTRTVSAAVRDAESATMRGAEREPDLLVGKRALLVEDNRTNRFVACELLKRFGIEADVAENGARAIEMIEASNYDVVLMDVQMPVMDGLEATRRLRADARFATLPIVAMTGNAMARDRDACFAAGMSGYLAKPIEPTAMYAEIVRVLPGANEAPLLDVDAALQRLGGNAALYASLLREFVRSRDETLREIADAAAVADREVLRALAHRVKGASAHLGALRLSLAAERLERISDGAEDVYAACADFRATFDRTIEAMRARVVDVRPSDGVDPSLARTRLEELHGMLRENDGTTAAFFAANAEMFAASLSEDEFDVLEHAILNFDEIEAYRALDAIDARLARGESA